MRHIGHDRLHLYIYKLFWKKFCKLNFLKAVSDTTIADSNKIKMKKSNHPYDLCISSPLPLREPSEFLRNCSPYPIFLNFHFPASKKRVIRGVGTYIYSSTNLRNNIWLFLGAFVEAFWYFLNDFTALGHAQYDFL